MLSEPQLKELHEEMLILLKWFHAFCMAHDIKYSLHGGTLLGAIREKGFIPWDDDMDVILTRPEYDKLLAVLQDRPLGRGISFQRFDKLPRLILKREGGKPIWMDIFVYDYISDCCPAQKCKIGGAMFFAGLTKPKETLDISKLRGYGRWKYIAYYVSYCLGRPFPLSWKLCVFDWFCKNCFCGRREYFHLSNDQYSGVKLILPASVMDGYVMVPFEDTELMVTSVYRFMLTTIYGDDYMTPKKYPDSESEAHDIIRGILEKRLECKDR